VVCWLLPFIQSEFGAKGIHHMNLGRLVAAARTTLWQQSQQDSLITSFYFFAFGILGAIWILAATYQIGE